MNFDNEYIYIYKDYRSEGYESKLYTIENAKKERKTPKKKINWILQTGYKKEFHSRYFHKCSLLIFSANIYYKV